MVRFLAASSTVFLTLRSDYSDLTKTRRKNQSHLRIYTYNEALNYFLNSYATDNVVVNTASETKSYRKHPYLAEVQYGEVMKDEALQCGDAFFEQQTESTFVKGLPLHVRDSMTGCWAERPNMLLCLLAKYVNIFMELGGNKPASLAVGQLFAESQDSGRDLNKSQERDHNRKQHTAVHAVTT